MKTKNILLLLISVIFLTSCKDDKNNSEENKQELKETFDVNFNLVVKKDDVFTLYYTEDGSLTFGDDRSIKSVVKGNDAAQDVIFKLPADVLPTHIRLDFGNNLEQENIIVNSLKIKYLESHLDFLYGSGKEDLAHYFYLLDTQVKYDSVTSTVELLKTKGQSYDPLMWSNELLSEEMIKLYSK